MSLRTDRHAPIAVRPIERADLDRLPLRCWPDRATLDRLFAEQGTIGMAAWEGDCCVAQLHCYRTTLPDGECPDWPAWNNWWSDACRAAVQDRAGVAWCHACLHVGRTLETCRQEMLALVNRFAQKHDWDVGQTTDALNALDGVSIERHEVSEAMRELRASGQTSFETVDTRCQGRGTGTALLQASVGWAKEKGYAAVLAMGAPRNLFAYAQWSGHMPWSTYARLGFEGIPVEEEDEMPAWTEIAPPEVAAQVQAALAAGRPVPALHERLMSLDLRR
jgi:GNAT superfamily N-acetyltransferase